MWTKKNKKVKETDPRTDAIARRIANGIAAFKKRIVGILQRWERNLTRGQKIIVLAVFFSISATYCSCILFGALLPGGSLAVSNPGRIYRIDPPPAYFFKDSAAYKTLLEHTGTSKNRPFKNK